MRYLLALATALLTALPVLSQDAAEDGPAGTYFTADVLNRGLGPRPRVMDLSTPQATVESFLDAVDRGDLGDAAHALNLNHLSPADQARQGADLADKLRTVLDRKAILSWRALLERPDALDAQQSSQAAMAGEPRRSVLLGVLDLEARERAVRLSRIWVPGEDAAWVFSEQTVRAVPALYDLYGPSELERMLPEWARAETVADLRMWELIGLPLVLTAAIVVGLAVWRMFRSLARRSAGWSGIVLRAIRWPLIIIASTSVILYGSLEFFSVSGAVSAVLTPLTLLGYVIAVLLFALSVIDTALDRVVTFDSDKLADPDNTTVRNTATLMTAARRVLIVIGVLAGAGIVLASANVFRSLGFSLLASAGALTLVFGFAGRQVLGNILASLQIAMNRSARIGDRVIYEGHYTTVERIHFTYVQLRTWNGNRLVVPVSKFVSDSFENWSMEDGGMTCYVKLTLAQEADIEALRSRFLDLCEAEDAVDDVEGCKVLSVDQDAFGHVVRFQFPVSDPTATWETECRMREALVAAAAELAEDSGRPVLPPLALDAAS